MKKFTEKPFMLVLTNGSDDDMAAAKSALAPVAEAFRAKDAALNFLYANPKLELTGRVCQFAHLSKDPQLVIINIEESTKCIAADQSITAENLSAFAQAFFEGKLTFGPVKPAPLSLTEALGNEFVNNKGEKFTLADLAGKNLGIYFSAHWCPPCRGFTPLLAKTYKMLKEDPSKPFEIIFVSADQSEKEFQSYFADMPWLTLAPSADLEHRKDSLNTIFDVEGIPTLVMMDPTMEKRNTEAVERVQEDLSGLDFPWLDVLVVAELAKVPGGASGKTEKHDCELAEYQGGGKWLCDECECCPPLNTPRMQCEDCGYDLCMDCWKTEKGGANDPKAGGEEECPGGVCQMPKK
jgi:thiol-disulfide isomerase/thioredoxin